MGTRGRDGNVLVAVKFGGGVGSLQTVIKLSDVRQSRVVCTQECDSIGVDLNVVLNLLTVFSLKNL